MRPLPASSVWWILGGLLGLAAVVTTVLLLAVGDGSEGDKVRLEAIRLAGTIVLGTGGGAALFVALRRQRATELDLVHKLAEAKAAQHDAEQRRVTELYTAAAEQLGHESAAVRLAGLYALQRLGQDHPEQRRPIVNVWCAYLRMPFRDPAAEGLDEHERAERRQELQVRLTVQRLLREHVHSGPHEGEPVVSRFWGDDLDVDLTGATLYELNLRGCRIHPHTIFTEAQFLGPTLFNEATFTGEHTSFFRATFTGEDAVVFFDDATFKSERTTSFVGVTFNSNTWFLRAAFTSERTWFNDATFTGERTSFAGATFNCGDIAFDDVVVPSTPLHIWPQGWIWQAADDVEAPVGGDPNVAWGRLVQPSAASSQGTPKPRQRARRLPSAERRDR